MRNEFQTCKGSAVRLGWIFFVFQRTRTVKPGPNQVMKVFRRWQQVEFETVENINTYSNRRVDRRYASWITSLLESFIHTSPHQPSDTFHRKTARARLWEILRFGDQLTPKTQVNSMFPGLWNLPWSWNYLTWWNNITTNSNSDLLCDLLSICWNK